MPSSSPALVNGASVKLSKPDRRTTGVLLGALSLACVALSLVAIFQTGIPGNPAPSETAPVESSQAITDSTAEGSLPAADNANNPADSDRAGGADDNEAPPSPETGSSPQTPESAPITISILVDSSAAESLGFPAAMASGSLRLPANSSAYDALRSTGLSLVGSPSYVSAIDGLAEKMMGAASGWTYSVNGNMPMTAACNYVLKPGDSLCWRYIT